MCSDKTPLSYLPQEIAVAGRQSDVVQQLAAGFCGCLDSGRVKGSVVWALLVLADSPAGDR